jgi:hypothetical protein
MGPNSLNDVQRYPLRYRLAYPWMDAFKAAILGSPYRRLRVVDIWSVMEKRFPGMNPSLVSFRRHDFFHLLSTFALSSVILI